MYDLLDTFLSAIIDLLTAVISSIPAPEFMNQSLNLTGFAGYIFNLFQIPTLLGIVGTAYLVRFLIRRLPVIG